MILFIQAIIDFFKSLFGISTPSLPSGTSAVVHAATGGSSSQPQQSEPEEEDLPYAQQEWKECQQQMAAFEARGEDLVGNDPNDPVGFWKKEFAMEADQQAGKPMSQIVREHGYRDEDHHDEVKRYIINKWCHLTVNEDGEQEVQQKLEFQNAMIQARMGQMQGMQAAAAAADPNLLAPVNGVSVEQWAGASARIASYGQSATAQQVAEALAEFGLDQASYDAANTGWQQKMQGDTTGAISVKFGEAFANAQGQAGGWSQGGAAPGGAGGEPCTFEHYVEVMAAQSAWAEQGLDVNAQLASVFGINAGEYSRYASYWSPKMSTDMAMLQRYTELEAHFKQKYAGAGMDDDLSL